MWPEKEASGIPDCMHWKTTLAGIIGAVAAAAADVLKTGASLTDWKTLVVPICIAILGVVAGDAKKTTP